MRNHPYERASQATYSCAASDSEAERGIGRHRVIRVSYLDSCPDASRDSAGKRAEENPIPDMALLVARGLGPCEVRSLLITSRIKHDYKGRTIQAVFAS